MAFTADRTAVFASIQKLRKQAQDVGTLKSTPQQEVETRTTSSGQEVIVIEPTNPQVVYVPQYNTTVVYTQAPTRRRSSSKTTTAPKSLAAGLIGFTAGIAIGAAMDNNYYYGPYGWHGGGYMYNDAWDDYYDHREDAREDWQDHREDLAEERGDRAENRQEQRTERQENRAGEPTRVAGADASEQQDRGAATQRAAGQRAKHRRRPHARASTGSAEARGYSEGARISRPAQQSSAAARTHSRDIRAANRNGRPVARRSEPKQQRAGRAAAADGVVERSRRTTRGLKQ